MTTSAYDAERDKFGRQVQWLVEIDLDRCTLVYTVGDCNASNLGDGSRCFYTYPTCQVPGVFDRDAKTLRFCLNHVPWPDSATPVYPLLEKIVSVPQKIDPGKLTVWPEKLQVRMLCDFNPPLMDHDKGEAYINTSKAGEFWRNLFARNRNYVGRPLRVLRGFNAPGIVLADFDQIGPEYLLTGATITRRGVTLTAESPLVELNRKKVPWSISDDNTVQDADVVSGGTGITDSDTTLSVLDASEFPDPSDYSRFSRLYIKIESEVCAYTAVDTGADTLTIERGSLNTAAAEHLTGTEIRHVALFGTDNGVSTPPSGQTLAECLQDFLHWAGIAAADIDTDTFDDLTDGFWPDSDVYRLLEKPDRITRLVKPLRESRGVVVYMDTAGKWAAKAIAPDESVTTYTADHFVKDSFKVIEDDERRLTRVALWYDPNTDNPGEDPVDYDKSVYVIDADLESDNYFREAKEELIADAWIYTGLATAKIRNIGRRLIARRRYGERRFVFRLEVKHAELNVGDGIGIEHELVTGFFGAAQVRYAIVTGKKDVKESVAEYEAVDTGYNGNYLRIGPDTMGSPYSSASEEDKTYGYWGDSNNRVGLVKVDGYIFW